MHPYKIQYVAGTDAIQSGKRMHMFVKVNIVRNIEIPIYSNINII